MRRLQEFHAQTPDAPRAELRAKILSAAREMYRALIGSTSATLVVFAPLAFLGGVTGGFFKALAVTMSAALILSLLFAVIVAPLLSEEWLRLKDVEQANKSERMMGGLQRGYQRIMTRGLARPGLVLAIVAVVMAVRAASANLGVAR